MSERLLLLDGHSLAYRAFFALPDSIATSTGQPTNAVYGFTSMLIKLLGDQGTDRIAVAFDAGPPTVRLAEYAEYKATRPETPSEFGPQIGLIREVLHTLRIPVFEVEEHEADDVLATLAASAAEEGLEAVIVTADRDFLQLVRPGIFVLFNRRGMSDYTLFDDAGVTDRFGVPPDQLVDVVALKGDPSDNLPRVPGIGEKTAAQLIREFGSIELLYEGLDNLPGRLARLRTALEEAEEQVRRNKRLATLVGDLPLKVKVRELQMGEWDPEEVRRLFVSLEFRSLLERLPTARVPRRDTSPAVEIEAVTDDGAPVPHGTVGIAWSEGSDGVAVAAAEDAVWWYPDPGAARDLLAEPSTRKVAHDAKTLAVRLYRARLDFSGAAFDTQVAAYLLDPAPGRYELADLSTRYLGRELPPTASLTDAQLALDLPEGDPAAAACARAAILPPLAVRLGIELDRLGMRRLFEDVEMPLIDVLARMETTGVAIDTSLLREQSSRLGAEIAALEADIHRHAGGAFNINSPPQLREVLYERLGLTPGRRTKTGFSTDAQALENLLGAHPIAEQLLRFRELTKLRSTYLDALPPLVDPSTGRLHATFKQTAVATGRISTESPNLQNIPVRTELGREIRRAFVAGFQDHVLMVADYSQIELRILAHITGDEGLADAFARDADVHAATAARLWKLSVDEVPRDLRNRAKAINFGLAYGMNVHGLAVRLGIAPDEAQEFVDAYFASFPKVREFMHQVVRDAHRDGYTTTLLGRRRYLPELEHRSPRVRALGERQALNAPIQGSAADLLKLAMIGADRALATSDLGARMVLTVHDELIFEVPSRQIDETRAAVVRAMEEAHPLSVPLKVDVATGATWAEAKA